MEPNADAEIICETKGPRLAWTEVMDRLIKLVRPYRCTAALTERAQLAEVIFILIEPDSPSTMFALRSEVRDAEGIN